MADVWDLVRIIAPKSFELLSRFRGQRLEGFDQTLLFMAVVSESVIKTEEAIERLATYTQLNSKKLDMILDKVNK